MVYDAAGNMLSRRTVDTGMDDKIDPSTSSGQVLQHTLSSLFITRFIYTDWNGDGKVATPTEILWEGQYYPFGLAHNGAWMDLADPEINYKYNGIELAKDLGINVNLAAFRTLDPVVGRWWQVDPKTEAVRALSPYQSMNNNPTVFSDTEGDFAWFAPLAVAMLKGAAIGVAANEINNAFQGNNFFQGGLKAAAFGALGGGLAHGIGLGAQALAKTGATGFQIGSVQAFGHGLSGGIQSQLDGGSFGSGFLSGAVSSGIGSLTSGWGDAGSLISGIGGGGLASIAG